MQFYHGYSGVTRSVVFSTGRWRAVLGKGYIMLNIAKDVTTCGVTCLTDTLIGRRTSIRIVVARGTAGFVGPVAFRALADGGYLISAFSQGFRFGIRRITLTGHTSVFVMTPTSTGMVNGVTGKVTSSVLAAAVLTTGYPGCISPTVGAGVFRGPVMRSGVGGLRRCKFRVVSPTDNCLTYKSAKTKGVPRPRALFSCVVGSLTYRGSVIKGGMVIATKPARRGVSPIHCVAGRSAKGVNCTVTRGYVHHNTRIALVAKPITVAPPPFMGIIPIMSTTSVTRTMGRATRRRSVVVGTTTITSCHPSRPISRGIGGGSKSTALAVRHARSVLSCLNTRGGPKRFLYKFSVRARRVLRGSHTGLTGGGTSVVITGGLGMTKTKFNASAGIIALVATSRYERLRVVDGTSITSTVIDRVLGGVY